MQTSTAFEICLASSLCCDLDICSPLFPPPNSDIADLANCILQAVSAIWRFSCIVYNLTGSKASLQVRYCASASIKHVQVLSSFRAAKGAHVHDAGNTSLLQLCTPLKLER